MRSLADLAAQAFAPDRTSCKCCGGPAPLFGQVDFNKNCEEARGFRLPPSGHLLTYHRCATCGFLFTRGLDHWTQAELEAHVYNEGYAAVDPEYAQARPDGWVEQLAGLFGQEFPRLSVLDWGGGNGRLAEGLRAKGVLRAETYEPFQPAFRTLPEGPFNFITCVEVLEHLPDPRQALGLMAAELPEKSCMLLSTLLQPDDLEAQGTGWWYLAPRNGHISLFSRQALEGLLAERGFRLEVLQPHIHFAWR
jgi:2-polyprenyl-6-hydroxyphenyl methylase/3-demethylubiquinone-9 3-methyltransferase